jgi:hypothetical protein
MMACFGKTASDRRMIAKETAQNASLFKHAAWALCIFTYPSPIVFKLSFITEYPAYFLSVDRQKLILNTHRMEKSVQRQSGLAVC